MQIPNDELVRVYRPGRDNPKIVCLGGGHGLSAMLRGLKKYSKNITAIVTVADDGGGSGMLREELGMLPPGDIRNCILALANTEPTMAKLLDYRFTEGSLSGQSFGNLFLAAMNGISNTFDEAVRLMGEVLAITGRVLPVTNQDVHLEAEFANGTKVLGESKIFLHKKEADCRIVQVRLVPEHPTPLAQSIEAIENADMIVMGPGSLYTSIIPNFLVQGVSQAVERSKGCKVLVLNIMTQEGETEGYTGADHLRALLCHGGANLVDVCLANNTLVPRDILPAYAKEGAEQIWVQEDKIREIGVDVEYFPLLQEGTTARHNPDALADALMEIYYNFHSNTN